MYPHFICSLPLVLGNMYLVNLEYDTSFIAKNFQYHVISQQLTILRVLRHVLDRRQVEPQDKLLENVFRRRNSV